MTETAEEIIREICKELDIEVIDMAVNVDHVHLFNEEPCGKPQGIINHITTLLRRGNPVASHREFSS